jgi:hypothetical protein
MGKSGVHKKVAILLNFLAGLEKQRPAAWHVPDKHAYLLTYLLTYLLHGAESFLRS